MDARTQSALDLGWRLVAATLSRLGALVGRSWLPGSVWSRAFAELRRAEAAARRLLVVLAGSVPLKAVPATGQACIHPVKHRAGGMGGRGFSLFDTLPDLAFERCEGTEAPSDPATIFHSTAGLAARLKALAALADNPSPAIRRMALWLARRCGPRTSPLRPGGPPGVGVDLMDLDCDVVLQCDLCARERLNRPAPP